MNGALLAASGFGLASSAIFAVGHSLDYRLLGHINRPIDPSPRGIDLWVWLVEGDRHLIIEGGCWVRRVGKPWEFFAGREVAVSLLAKQKRTVDA